MRRAMPPPPRAAPPSLAAKTAALAATVAKVARKSCRASTWQQYAASYRHFAVHCNGRPLEARPEDVAAYLADLAETKKKWPAVDKARSAIATNAAVSRSQQAQSKSCAMNFSSNGGSGRS